MSFIIATGNIIGFLLLSVVAIIQSIAKCFIPSKYKMKSVAGEIALVTGGGSGLGRLLSLRLADLGVTVVVWDINESGIEETVKLVQSAGGTCYGYVCDLCNREDVYKKAAVIRQEVGKVSILINNAGFVSGTNFLDTPDELLLRTMEVNIMSHFWTVKAFLPAMMEDKKGHIVSIASLAGHVGIPRLVDYCTSKFAAVGFAEALRLELSFECPDINTTVICPYFIRNTGMFEEVAARYISAIPANEVAERVITALRLNEQIAIIPGFLTGLLVAKWIFPWTCVEMFLRGLIKDAFPDIEKPPSKTDNCIEKTAELSKDQKGVALHEQLARRVSSSERKP